MKLLIIGSIVFLLLFVVFARGSRAQDGISMKNTAYPADNLITGGQPTIADLIALKEKGLTTVINLRGLKEKLGFDEITTLKELGIKYVQIPMSSPEDLSLENAVKLDKALKNVKGTALVHCASSNRVGALLALREFHIKGKTAEEAMAFGKASGMKSLTPTVKRALVK